jgi:hypothetical protein
MEALRHHWHQASPRGMQLHSVHFNIVISRGYVEGREEADVNGQHGNRKTVVNVANRVARTPPRDSESAARS